MRRTSKPLTLPALKRKLDQQKTTLEREIHKLEDLVTQAIATRDKTYLARQHIQQAIEALEGTR